MSTCCASSIPVISGIVRSLITAAKLSGAARYASSASDGRDADSRHRKLALIIEENHFSGLRRVFWKVAQKPAKPLFFGVRDNHAHLALPGNPGAVLISLALHVRRALDCLEGAAEPGPAWNRARLAQPVEHDTQRVRLLRMRLEYTGDGTAVLQPLPKQDSHMLSNLAAAQVLAWVPIGDGECAAGSVLRWTALPD